MVVPSDEGSPAETLWRVSPAAGQPRVTRTHTESTTVVTRGQDADATSDAALQDEMPKMSEDAGTSVFSIIDDDVCRAILERLIIVNDAVISDIYILTPSHVGAGEDAIQGSGASACVGSDHRRPRRRATLGLLAGVEENQGA